MKQLKMLLAAVVFSLFAAPVLAELTLSPQTIEITDVTSTSTIQVLYRDKPLPRADIEKVVLGVFKFRDDVPEGDADGEHFSDYTYMFKLRVNDDGSVSLTANENSLQLGKYDIYVHTRHGTATGLVDAHLRDEIAGHVPQAISKAKVIHDPRLRTYLYGQAIAIDLGPDPVNSYSWYVNGDLQSSGKGNTAVRLWPEPGANEVSLVVRNPDGGVIHEWSDKTTIRKEPEMKTSVRKGSSVSFAAPTGYTRVTWALNGKILAENNPQSTTSDKQTVKFSKKGTQTLTCKAEGGENGHFRFLTWSVDVR